MTDIAQLHRRALDATHKIVAGIQPDQRTLPTPDEGWDVRALLNHIVSGNLWAVELTAGQTIDEVGDRERNPELGAVVGCICSYDGEAVAGLCLEVRVGREPDGAGGGTDGEEG